MTAIEPQVNLSARYSVNETCALLGICRSSLYNYEAKGRLKSGMRRNTTKKFFKGADILAFWKAQM